MAMDLQAQREQGERIKERREALHLTQPVVADRVGITLRAYQAWESGASDIKWGNLVKLATVLGSTPDHLKAGPPQATAAEVSQLDRIEAMLQEVLARLDAQGVTHTSPEDIANEGARQRQKRTSAADASARRSPRSAQGA